MSDKAQGYKAQEDARYKPNVLRRLTDFDPFTKREGDRDAITLKQLKEDVFENIEMLFNSRSHPSLQDLKGYEELEDSVLGYGISDYCGSTYTAQDWEALRDHILTQLHRFEPRLVPDSIEVTFVPSDQRVNSLMEFRISGLIQADQMSEEVLFISKLDMETGAAELTY